MSIATAKVAGVENIVACSVPTAEHGGIHPADFLRHVWAAGDNDMKVGLDAGVTEYQVKLDKDRLLESVHGFMA